MIDKHVLRLCFKFK